MCWPAVHGKGLRPVRTGFFENSDTTLQRKEKEISLTDCWFMVHAGRCKDRAPKKLRKVWSYHAKPQGNGAWCSATTYKVLNCKLEKLDLEQECETWPVTSVIGEISVARTSGYAVDARRTFAWSDVSKSRRSCDMVRFPRRNGQIFGATKSIRWILLWTSREFHVTLKTLEALGKSLENQRFWSNGSEKPVQG